FTPGTRFRRWSRPHGSALLHELRILEIHSGGAAGGRGLRRIFILIQGSKITACFSGHEQSLCTQPTIPPVTTAVPPQWRDCFVYREYSSLNSRNLLASRVLISVSFIRHSQLPPSRD